VEFKPAVLQERDNQDCLEKWGLLKHSRFFKFRYEQYLKPYEFDAFLLDFFSSPEVRSTFQTVSRSGAWGHTGASKVEKVDAEHLVCTQTSMTFFDRLTEAGIVRKTGHIAKMIEEEIDGVMVYDKLGQMFVDEACENWELYRAEERKELLFRIMRALVLGGGVNQYEDTFEPYSKLAKTIYKDMVSVVKNPMSEKLEVASFAAAVRDIDGLALWPFDAGQNFCLIAVDPIKRHVTMWYGAYVPPW